MKTADPRGGLVRDKPGDPGRGGHPIHANANHACQSIRAPRKANIAIRCAGASCPRARWKSTRTRKRTLVRASVFERVLAAGTKLTVTITRKGYVGKRTVFVIRRGKAPLRRDSCLSTRGKVMKCPAG